MTRNTVRAQWAHTADPCNKVSLRENPPLCLSPKGQQEAVSSSSLRATPEPEKWLWEKMFGDFSEQCIAVQ
jgi:hypothetical protein